MSSRQRILESISDLARRLGRTPSLSEFTKRTRIHRYQVAKAFPRWNDAVKAARLEPYRLYTRPGDGEILKDWGETVRRKRAAPSRRAYLLDGRYDPRTLEKRFGSWGSIPRAFREFARGKPEWRDVAAILAGPLPRWRRGRPRRNVRQLKDRTTYGNPMDFRGLRHEPVNEQGVVLLFGMVAKELGYLVEAVQKGFPDCEAKRRIGPERWQRVRIEFEFESRNFRDHGHPSTGCDIIVCWRHNWAECPEHIEVVELSSVIKSLANSED